jgi:hypothetical protein
LYLGEKAVQVDEFLFTHGCEEIKHEGL